MATGPAEAGAPIQQPPRCRRNNRIKMSRELMVRLEVALGGRKQPGRASSSRPPTVSRAEHELQVEGRRPQPAAAASFTDCCAGRIRSSHGARHPRLADLSQSSLEEVKTTTTSGRDECDFIAGTRAIILASLRAPPDAKLISRYEHAAIGKLNSISDTFGGR